MSVIWSAGLVVDAAVGMQALIPGSSLDASGVAEPGPTRAWAPSPGIT